MLSGLTLEVCIEKRKQPDTTKGCQQAPTATGASFQKIRSSRHPTELYDWFTGGSTLRVLVACEYSGRVRDAFIAAGHDAMSCDLLPTDVDGPHYQGDVRDVLMEHWDLMIAHPPCAHLAVSGARWFKDKVQEQIEALEFVRMLMAAPIERIAIENPVSVISTKIRKPDQIIQPWQHGHGETKTTCLWLKNLPLLVPSCIVPGREAIVHKMAPSPDRWKKGALPTKALPMLWRSSGGKLTLRLRGAVFDAST